MVPSRPWWALLLLVLSACAGLRLGDLGLGLGGGWRNPCERGDDPEGCAQLVAAVRELEKSEVAEPHLTRACAQGSHEACHQRARLLLADTDSGRNAAGQLLAERLCLNGHALACETASKTPLCKPDTHCQAMRERACMGGVKSACPQQPQLAGGTSSPTNLEAQCNAGNYKACSELNLRAVTTSDSGRGQDARAKLEHTCDQGEARACYELARQLQYEHDNPGNAARALKLRNRACLAGLEEACGPATPTGTATAPQGTPAPSQEQATVSGPTCAPGETSCSTPSGLLWAEPPVLEELNEQERAEALATSEAKCAAGEGEACMALAELHLTGRGADKAMAPALAAYRRACVSGATAGCLQVALLDGLESRCAGRDGEACTTLGRLLLRPPLTENDRTRGQEVLQRTCDQGQMSACLVLGDILSKGRPGLPVDLDRAAELLVRARSLGYRGTSTDWAINFQKSRTDCQKRRRTACVALGEQYKATLLSSGVEATGSPDWARAQTAVQLACELGAPRGCVLAGELTLQLNGEKAQAESLRYAERGCVGAPEGCHAVAELLRQLLGEKTVPAKSGALYQTACTARHAPSCFRVAEGQEQGLYGWKPTPERALTMYRMACELGDFRACRKVP
jgi:TPR repeat protein